MALVAIVALADAAPESRDRRLDIPWAMLARTTRERLRDVIEQAVFSRELHGIVVQSEPSVFDFLIEHPDVAASAGRVLGIVRYRVVKERDGRYWGDDAHGASGFFELLHAEPGKRVYLAEGTFVKRYLPTIRGRIALVLAFEHRVDHRRQGQVLTDVRGYLKIDNRVLGILARIARPVVGPIVDRKVLRTFHAASKLAEQASRDPLGLYATLAASRQFDEQALEGLRRVLRCCPQTSPIDD
jgi:hypothetical protein